MKEKNSLERHYLLYTQRREARSGGGPRINKKKITKTQKFKNVDSVDESRAASVDLSLLGMAIAIPMHEAFRGHNRNYFYALFSMTERMKILEKVFLLFPDSFNLKTRVHKKHFTKSQPPRDYLMN